MPRNGLGQYSRPANTTAITGQTITASLWETMIVDLIADANTDRPVSAGGTGASTAADARTNLGLGTAATHNEGPGGGLDADTVDGIQGSSLARTDQVPIFDSGSIHIRGDSSAVRLEDTTSGAHDFWLYVNNNVFYILTDRDDDGVWETPHPIQIEPDVNRALLFGNDIVVDTRTIATGGGLTGGGDLSANRTISHADTSSQASVNNSGNTFIQDITLDIYGHVTNINSATASFTSWPGVYTGTNINNSSYPVGSYLYVQDTSAPNRNSTQSVWTWSGLYSHYTLGSGGTAMAGTWRTRGMYQNGILVQRVA